MTHRRKLIEVALPLEAINEASAREKSIRHGHPSTLHLWWARRPLAAARAVIFTSLVDDPDSPDALPAFVEACKGLPIGANVKANGDTPRMRLFDFIERLVTWEATTDEAILNTARELILIATEGSPPPLLDPFAGGGSIPLEAQRLGLEAHASDLNPVAVMINKAQIEIPPRFANMPPVNPRDNPRPLTLNPSPTASGGEGLEDAARSSDEEHSPSPREAWERGQEGEGAGGEGQERWHITPEMRERMTEIARSLRKNATPSEDILWQALRNRKLEGRKFKRQVDVGPFVLDFYCPEERLAVEVDGSIHALQQEADQQRQQLIESLGIRFVRLDAQLVESNLAQALKQIRSAFKSRQQSALPLSSRSVGEGAGGEGHLWRGAAGLAADVRYYGEWMREKAWEKIGHLYPTHNGETVIAWLWARTVTSPNPAVNAPVPLVRSFILSKKKGRERWAKPIIEGNTVRFEVTEGLPPNGKDGTMGRQFGGGRCVVSGVPMSWDYIRDEGKAGRMGLMLMAIVTEGKSGRSYYAPTEDQLHTATSAEQADFWKPSGEMPLKHRNFQPPVYGMYEYGDLFTPRQLVALTTFSDLVAEAREQAHADALAAGLADDDVPLRDGGRGARAYAEAVSVYLGMNVSKQANRTSNINFWDPQGEKVQQVFARQAIPMVWNFTEGNPFSDSSGNFLGQLEYMMRVIESLPADSLGYAVQQDASQLNLNTRILSTDPPYYDNIGYADLSDFFYVWMRKALREVYPDIFGTMLVPKEPELIASPYRHGGKEAANAHFESGMVQTFTNIRRFVSSDYPLSVYYAFKQQDAEAEDEDAPTPGPSPKMREGKKKSTDLDSPSLSVGEGAGGWGGRTSTGWETMLTGLIQSGFSIDGTWPMRTELTGNLKKNNNALASSIVLVCRPRPDDAPTISRRAFVDALRRELPAALKNMQSGNIAPVDLAQASIGPGMAIYSRYSKVLEADGSAMSVRAALGLINQELDAYLAEQDGDIDADTRFAVSWFEQFGFGEGEFGQADVLARAKNTSVAGVESAGLVVSGRGKVRLIHWREYDPSALTLNPSPTARSSRGEGLPDSSVSVPLSSRSVGEGTGVRGKGWDPQQDKRPTVWEATHHLIERLNSHGETGSALLMTRMPHDMAAEARNLAYRLYSICERKGWADHARDYNALVISWAGIGEETARLREQQAAGDARVQLGLFDEE
jgi:putative DNA methylase